MLHVLTVCIARHSRSETYRSYERRDFVGVTRYGPRGAKLSWLCLSPHCRNFLLKFPFTDVFMRLETAMYSSRGILRRIWRVTDHDR
jgi:hypothetical protein